MGKVNLHSTGKVSENTQISHRRCYLADLELMRTHAIPNVFVNVQIPIKWKYTAESHIFPGCGFLRRLEVIMKLK